MTLYSTKPAKITGNKDLHSLQIIGWAGKTSSRGMYVISPKTGLACVEYVHRQIEKALHTGKYLAESMNSEALSSLVFIADGGALIAQGIAKAIESAGFQPPKIHGINPKSGQFPEEAIEAAKNSGTLILCEDIMFWGNKATYSQLSWEFDWEPLEAVDVTLCPVEQG